MPSPALVETVARGRRPFPLLKVAWTARGLDLGTDIVAPAGRVTALGQVTRVSKPGGWDPIVYGAGIEGGKVKPVETAVSVSDADGSLFRMLDTYEPRGSAAAIYGAAAGLVEADLSAWFVGIIHDWEPDEPFTRLLMKTDDAPLRAPVPGPVFKRAEWSSAADATIFGVQMPLILGIHDAYRVTARGMVPGVNVAYNPDLGFRWLVSLGHQVDVRRIHYDGTPISGGKGSWWHIRREVIGRARLTFVEIDEGFQAEEAAVVAFDVEGPDANGDQAGAAVTNPVLQLRAILEEYTYRTPPLGVWRGAHSIIDDASWSAAATFFDTHGHESARRFGGDQGEVSAAEVCQSFLDAYPWTRIDWSPTGTLVMTVIDFDDVDPVGADWLDLGRHHKGGRVPFFRGDRREVYSLISQPYMYSSQEQKFLAAYEAHDVGVPDGDVVPLPIENPWSQGRFIQE